MDGRVGALGRSLAMCVLALCHALSFALLGVAAFALLGVAAVVGGIDSGSGWLVLLGLVYVEMVFDLIRFPFQALLRRRSVRKITTAVQLPALSVIAYFSFPDHPVWTALLFLSGLGILVIDWVRPAGVRKEL